MKAAVFGKMLFRIILIFNVMFIVFSIISEVVSGTGVSWNWFAAQYPALFLWPSGLAVIAFLSFRIKTMRITFDDRALTADHLLRILSKLKYEIVWEGPSWSVFKQKNKLKRIVPGFEDTCVVQSNSDDFELTGYAEDLKQVNRMIEQEYYLNETSGLST